MRDNDIPSVVYYPISGHLQTGYMYLKYKEGDFPISEDLGSRILSLPMHPYLEEEDIKLITNVIKDNIEV